MGKGTAAALKRQNISPDFIGTGSPKMTAMEFLKKAKGQKVLFVRAKNSKKSIQSLLKKKLEVADLVAYNNIISSDFNLPVCDCLVFTSPMNVQAYFEKYTVQKHQKVIAIGKTTQKALNKLGVTDVLVAKNPSEESLAETVLAILPDRYAVIDLGTNTFHLLIAEKQKNHRFKELHRQRFFVKLAEEGIETIGAEPVKRGMQALKVFREIIDELKIKKIKAIGTAALRTASNGQQFLGAVKESFSLKVELIDGGREAELIYKGVVQAVPFQDQNYLLMDIGGGSVEFIIANQKRSYGRKVFQSG